MTQKDETEQSRNELRGESLMPREIWAWNVDHDQGCWDLEDEYPIEGCRTPYILKSEYNKQTDRVGELEIVLRKADYLLKDTGMITNDSWMHQQIQIALTTALKKGEDDE